MGKILGIDYGEARIGLALTSADRRFVFTSQTIENISSDHSIAAVKGICLTEGVEMIVIGLPLDQHGHEGPKAQAVKAWGALVSQATQVRAVYEDERYTSALAYSLKKQAGWSTKDTRTTLDQTAATLILQSYLDKHHG